MMDLPAVCRECGHMFSSGIFMSGINSSFSGNKSSCPNCGSMAEVLDGKIDSSGKIHFVKLAYGLLTSSHVVPENLEKLKGIISSQQDEQNAEVEPFLQTIAQEIPELSALKDFLVPTNAGEFYSMLAFLLTLIIFIQTMVSSQKKPTQTVINNYYGASDPEAAGYKAALESGGLRRKDLCPCGSGKKFKNCHGE